MLLESNFFYGVDDIECGDIVVTYKNSKGEPTVSETLITKKGGTEAVDTVAFANVYTASTNITLWISIAVGAVGVGAVALVLVLVSKKKRAKKA